MGKVVESVGKAVGNVAKAVGKTVFENPARALGSLARGDLKGTLTSLVDTAAGAMGEGALWKAQGVGVDGYKERKALKGSSAPVQLVKKSAATSGLVQQRIGKGGGGGSWSEIAKYSTGGKTGKTGAEAAVPVKKSKMGS